MSDTPASQDPTAAAAQTGQAPESVMNTMIGSSGASEGHSIDAMLNVGMKVQIILGYSRMPIANLLKLSRGSVIELDKRIGEPVDVVINDRLVARGDLIKISDNRIGISLNEIIKDYVSES